MSTVFVGLIAIILLTCAISWCVRKAETQGHPQTERREMPATVQPADIPQTEAAAPQDADTVEEVLAAVTAAVAMEENVDFSEVQVLSFREV